MQIRGTVSCCSPPGIERVIRTPREEADRCARSSSCVFDDDLVILPRVVVLARLGTAAAGVGVGDQTVGPTTIILTLLSSMGGLLFG